MPANQGPHASKDITEWNIPGEQPSTYVLIDGKSWHKTKPTIGANINNAYRRLTYLDACHLNCKCVFNVVEV